MPKFANPNEVTQFVRDRRETSSSSRETLARYFCDKLSYYEGIQWSLGLMGAGTSIQRLRADLNPDSLNFRPSLNRVARYLQRAAVATAPIRLEMDVNPPDRDITAEGSMRAQILEDCAHLWTGSAGLLENWDDANFRRGLYGSYMVGLTLKAAGRGTQLSGAADCAIEAFSDSPLKLTLDPYVDRRRLHEHEEVIYSDAWSYAKIMRHLGPMLKAQKIELNEKDLPTLGDLCTFEIEVARYTAGGLFGQYQQNSDTHGAMVHEMYCKDETGRFGGYYVMIELARGRRDEGGLLLLNPDNPMSPWGGIGLPWVLIHGHRRGAGPFGIGEVAMQKDDQDRLNRNNWRRERQEQNASKHMTLIDENSMGGVKDYAQIVRRVTNTVGQVVTWNSGLPDRPAQAPQVLSIPAPNGHFGAEIEASESAMREQVHRAAIHSGEIQTHTPLGAVQLAKEEAGQVLDKRVHEDRTAMARLIEVGTGTVVKLVQAGSPGTIKMLEQAGFDAMDLGTLAALDATNMRADFKVREGSIRMRSAAARIADLDNAMKLPTPPLTAAEYRSERSDMDLSLTREDRVYSATFAKYARDLLTGAMPQWVPIPLAERVPDLIREFRKAMIDRGADEAARARLSQAIMDQQMFEAGQQAQMQAMLNPQQPGAGAAQSQQPIPPAGTIDDLVAQLGSQVTQAA